MLQCSIAQNAAQHLLLRMQRFSLICLSFKAVHNLNAARSIMSAPQLKPYFVSYVNAHYEDVHDQLVFAYNEPHAIKIVLETYEDAKFVFHSKEVAETLETEAA